MYLLRARIDLASGVEVLMKMVVGQTAVHHLDRSDFNNTMAKAGFQARGFSV